MTSFIHLFLKTELTCIPKILEKCFGNYYNNTLCNGATWVFLLWCFLHTVFDTLLEGLLRKMKYKQFVRIRLKKSLWDLGFYSAALLYTNASLLRNGVQLFKFKSLEIHPDSSISGQLILGFIFLSSYYIHSSLWEGLRYNNMLRLTSQILLALFMVFAYFMKIVEISFAVIAVISIVQIIVNITICMHTLSSYNNVVYTYFTKVILAASTLSIILGYIILIPAIAIVPLALIIISKVPSFILVTTFLLIVGHITSELYDSPLRRLIDHWLDGHPEGCDVMECMLYAPRTDEAHTLALMRADIKLRKSSLKTSGKGKLYQTLKCMIAIKRKIQSKRTSDTNEKDAADINAHEDNTGSLEANENNYILAETILVNNATVDNKVNLKVPSTEEQTASDFIKTKQDTESEKTLKSDDDEELENNKYDEEVIMHNSIFDIGDISDTSLDSLSESDTAISSESK